MRDIVVMVFGLINTFDDLMCFDDAADKRYKLMNQVIKVRIYGRRMFESLAVITTATTKTKGII